MAGHLPRLLLLIPALLGCLALSACGSDGESTGSDGAAQEPAARTETAPSPLEQREALKDTGVKPEIPKPIGSPPRKLVKEDIVKGKGPAAKTGDSLTVNYAGISYSTGEEFDASWNNGAPFSFQLGGQVIEGWNKGIVGMRAGGRRMLTIPPELGYGSQGSGPIAPNETLVFVVDLVSID